MPIIQVKLKQVAKSNMRLKDYMVTLQAVGVTISMYRSDTLLVKGDTAQEDDVVELESML